MKKTICVLLVSGMLLCTGCLAHQNDSSSSLNQMVEGIPNDVRVKLQAAIDMAPVQLSSDTITDEAVTNLIFIGGETLKKPCTIGDFGNGVNIRQDDSLIQKKKKNNGFSDVLRFECCKLHRDGKRHC